jgi:hypothetical protein
MNLENFTYSCCVLPNYPEMVNITKAPKCEFVSWCKEMYPNIRFLSFAHGGLDNTIMGIGENNEDLFTLHYYIVPPLTKIITDSLFAKHRNERIHLSDNLDTLGKWVCEKYPMANYIKFIDENTLHILCGNDKICSFSIPISYNKSKLVQDYENNNYCGDY